MKKKLSGEKTKHTLTLRPLLSLSPLKERERIALLMSGKEDIDLFIDQYPMDFYKLIRNHVDFAEWFENELALDAETVEMMTSITSDNLMELAKMSPKGFLSMVLSSKKSYTNFLHKDPMLFYRMAKTLFPDITAEYYIVMQIHKIANMWNDDGKDTFRMERDLEMTGSSSFGELKVFNFWKTDDNIPSLSQYIKIDQSFIEPNVLKQCKDDPVTRWKVHDLFRMTYPLGLPHKEYCYTSDVVLLVRVWMIDRILDVLNKVEYVTPHIEILKDRMRNTADYFSAFDSTRYSTSRHMYGLWRYMVLNVDFNDEVVKYDDYIHLVHDDKENDTTLSWPLTTTTGDDDMVVLGPSLNTTIDKGNHKSGITMVNNVQTERYVRLERLYNDYMTVNPLFRRTLKLSSLLEYYEDVMKFEEEVKLAVKDLKQYVHDASRLPKDEVTREVRLKMTNCQMDIEILETALIYYASWRRSVLKDIRKYDNEKVSREEDELFVNSNLLSTLKMVDLFDDPTQCPFNEVFFPKEKDPVIMQIEEGEVTNWEPYQECNRWLNFVSKRVQYLDKTPEATIYGYDQLQTISYKSTSSCLMCKKKCDNEEPHFGVRICNEYCQRDWYQSKGILECFYE